MTTFNTQTANEANLLRGALRSNAIFSAVSGIVMVLGAGPMTTFLGIAEAGPLRLIGAGLFIWAAFAVYVAAQRPPSRGLVWLIIGGDLLWVVGSVLLIALDPLALTTGGKWLVALLADIVLLFAIVQFVGLRRLSR